MHCRSKVYNANRYRQRDTINTWQSKLRLLATMSEWHNNFTGNWVSHESCGVVCVCFYPSVLACVYHCQYHWASVYMMGAWSWNRTWRESDREREREREKERERERERERGGGGRERERVDPGVRMAKQSSNSLLIMMNMQQGDWVPFASSSSPATQRTPLTFLFQSDALQFSFNCFQALELKRYDEKEEPLLEPKWDVSDLIPTSIVQW